MAHQVGEAAGRRGRACAIAVDLAGPKLRTEITADAPVVRRVSPRRDGRGVVVAPARVLFHHQDDVPRDLPVDVVAVPVLERFWLRSREVGDVVHLTDARLSHRQLTVVVAAGRTVLAELRKTAYVESGATLKVKRDGMGQVATVGSLPPPEASVLVSVDDELVVGPVDRPRPFDEVGVPWIGCTLPEALEQARVGDRIWFDDGKVGGVVVAAEGGELRVRIVDARPGGVRLRSGKGINLPDTELPVAGLTEQDERDLAVAVEFADLVNVSFVRSPSDVAFVQERLGQHGATDVGIVLKIETVSGFEQLPEILLAAMCWDRVGVMIARGDLAVEAGFERMAEVQEEILWLCEAAHVPVIWATQVLDQLARTGRPSRAEITDAALSARAECIMLNKGPHIAAAITALIDIHGRMHDHQHKKRSLLRRLRAWDHRQDEA
jgi:pyruvate kinase